MNKEIISLSNLINSTDYPKNILEMVDNHLKSIFLASDVRFCKSYINGRQRGFYIPVIVGGKNIGYYKIIGAKNKLSNDEFNVLFSLLTQLYSRISDVLNKDKDNFVYDISHLQKYQNNLDLSTLVKLNCLFINAFDYDKIVGIFGEEAARYMMGIIVDNIKRIFNLSNDTIFYYNDNQIVIIITNQTDVSINARALNLKSALSSIDININYSLSSARGKVDLYNLILLAEQNIGCFNEEFNRCY